MAKIIGGTTSTPPKPFGVDLSEYATKEELNGKENQLNAFGGIILDREADWGITGIGIDTEFVATKEDLEAKADKEGKFKLLQTTTVEEAEIHTVEFTNLNLEKAYLFASFPADSEKKIVGGRIYLYGAAHLINFYTAEAISTSARYFHVFAEKNNGVWNNVWKKSSTKNDLNNIGGRSYVDHSELWLNENCKHNIESVSITAGDSDKTVYFPIGTKFYLLGVTN